MKMLQKKGFKKAVVMLLLTLMVSNLSVFAAEISEKVVTPENGWIRFDDRDSNISYIGVWYQRTHPDFYKTTRAISSDDTGSILFNFTGDKLRILGSDHDEYTKNATIEIDGELAGSFSQQTELHTGVGNILNFEALNLENKEHCVKITFISETDYLYLTLDAIDIAEGESLLPYNEIINNKILTITPDKSTIKVGEEVTTELAIDNITDIAAEDIRIAYDSEKLEYLGHEEVDGIKLVYNDVKNGELRFILASKGESNLITAKTALLKLKFKGIKTGEALADITKGRVSDGIEMEKDLTDEECDQTIITIEGLNDVNNSGEFTLLDLAIDARHLLKDPTLAELAGYNTDVVVNNAIDEDDLLEIGKYMLLNPNYTPNN